MGSREAWVDPLMWDLAAVAAPVLDRPASDVDDTLVHIVCSCTPDVALCGRPVPGADLTDTPAGPICVVCHDLDRQPCPTCGYI